MTVIAWFTCVVPATVSAVRDAIEFHVPGFFDVMSKGMVTEPPAVGGEVLTLNSWPLTGAEAIFAPLEPVRFSAPQFWPEDGSPEPALPRPGPSVGKLRFGPYE